MPSLPAGFQLGPYQVLAPIGSGGMGEVYRATDTRLRRTVAIKVLPAHLAESAERRQRFEREARAVSSLNHPHICTLHDVGRQDGIEYLVMEYVEGETLASRLERGPLPMDQVARLGAQIADALARAHGAGVVHRDLKPANVMLTKTGVKVLDFGLAKLEDEAPETVDTSSPTRSRHLTSDGTLLGTLPYMAPEQVEGRSADPRSDIWALGAILYEMATGKPAFAANSQAGLIAAILEHDPPPLSALAPTAPPALDRLVRACLAKDPDARWQSARDAASELQWISEGVAAPAGAGVHPSRGERWLAAAIFFFITTSVLAVIHVRGRTAAKGDAHPVRFIVSPPGSATTAGTPALSPDGLRLAFVATEGNRSVVWIRDLQSLASRPLATTAGASLNAPPFWSPDGRQLAFFASGKLKKADVRGGSAEILADAPEGRGGAWSAGGTIVFAPRTIGALLAVAASGGTPAPVTQLDEGRREFSHRFPSFLPDDRRFVYWVEAGSDAELVALGGAVREMQVGSLDAKGVLARFPSATSTMVYAPPGYLLFQRQHVLVAQPFDTGTLRTTGDPVTVAEGLARADGPGMPYGAPGFSVSRTGALAYRESQRLESRLAWLDRGGRRLEVLGPAAQNRNHRLSPNGRRIAVARIDPETERSDIWILEAGGAAPQRLTFDPAGATRPVWSPDGARIAFNSARTPGTGIYQRLASGAGTEAPLLLLVPTQEPFPMDWSSDGNVLIYSFSLPPTRANIGVLSLPDGSARAPFLETAADEVQAQLSHDGRWLAYCSDESGRYEVYVRSFPSGAGRWQISSGGGFEPRWRGDDAEIFYLSGDVKMMAVPVRRAATFEVSPPRVLFEAPVSGLLQGWEGANHYDVTADGQRFLVNTPVEGGPGSAMVVVLDWIAGVSK